MNQLDRLERLAQRLIEVPFRHFFKMRLHQADLVDHLLDAVEEGRRNGQGPDTVPNAYLVTVNPADYDALIRQSTADVIVTELHTSVTGWVAEANYQFDGSLQIQLVQDETVSCGQVEVKAENVAAL